MLRRVLIKLVEVERLKAEFIVSYIWAIRYHPRGIMSTLIFPIISTIL
jgi:hypothetical protein